MDGRPEPFFDKQKHRAPLFTDLVEQEEPPRVSRRLLLELQSSLDMEVLLEIFFRHLRQHLPCRRLVYEFSPLGLFLMLGEGGSHSAEYVLKVAGEKLGRIRFHRRRPFGEEELERIEWLLGALVLPVRNALRYRQALRAAYVDPLTGLKNRLSYQDNLAREMSRAQRENQRLGLMVVDIDHFKHINDEVGHLAGDQVLVSVAQALKGCVRKSDMVFRYAGDEFVLLLPNIRRHCLHPLKARLEEAVTRLECRHGDRKIPISASIGAAILEPGMDGRALFEAADLDMLRNKEHRRANAVNRHRRTG